MKKHTNQFLLKYLHCSRYGRVATLYMDIEKQSFKPNEYDAGSTI